MARPKGGKHSNNRAAESHDPKWRAPASGRGRSGKFGGGEREEGKPPATEQRMADEGHPTIGTSTPRGRTRVTTKADDQN